MNAVKHGSDPRVPAREVCVVRYLLDRWAAERGDMTYVIFDAARRYTYREMRERVISVAVGLAQLGVKQGDHVMAWQPTSPEMLTTYYAINYLGAVFVPINTAYRGRLLEHVIENSDAKLAVERHRLESVGALGGDRDGGGAGARGSAGGSDRDRAAAVHSVRRVDGHRG
jgi:acyl-CoA synthetase (AMP-forming)/AMP-acid ligase II